jgi:hypothetical protein
VELNKRTKIIGGVMVVGLAALAYDRLSGGPDAAVAAPANPASAAAAPSGNPPAAAPHPAGEHGALAGALADRLGQLGRPSDSRPDAFVAPVAWFPPPAAAEKEKTEKKTIDLTKYHVTSVMESKDSKHPSTVVVNGHPLVGGKAWMSPDKQETLELIEATPQRGVVRVRINGQECELKLPENMSDKAKPDEGAGQG